MMNHKILTSAKTGYFCFAGLILIFIFFPLIKTSIPAPFWFQEHFFNTLKIVENLKKSGFPTFDNSTLTNDFSPVWGIILTGLSYVVDIHSTTFFILTRAILGISLGASLLLFNRLIFALGFKPKPEIRFLASAFLAALFTYIALNGSETVLAIPCLFLNALCLLKTLRHPKISTAAVYGLSIVLCAFTRFDSAAFFLMVSLVFYFQFNGLSPVTTKELLKIFLGLGIGLIPLMVWADINQTIFETPLPTGLVSWTQTQDHAPWRIALLLIIEPIRYIRQIPAAIALLTFPALLLGLTAYVSFPWGQEKRMPSDTVFYSLIWYPILYLMVISVITFIALPEYALYPLAIGSPVALLFAVCRIDEQLKERKQEQKQALTVWLILGICFCLITFFLAIRPRSAFYVPITKTVAEFSQHNNGLYAMGTGAGITSFITKRDFTRLDGLAQNMKMLTFLERQAPLKEVFKHYGVRYYIAVNPKAENGCYAVREPVQNRYGGSNKGNSDWLCFEPVFLKQATPQIKIGIFDLQGQLP